MDGVITGGGALTVQADGDNLADADAFVVGLSGLGISGGGAFANIADTADVEATLAATGSVHVAGAIPGHGAFGQRCAGRLRCRSRRRGRRLELASRMRESRAEPKRSLTRMWWTQIGDSSPVTVRATSDNDATAESDHGEFRHVQPKQGLVDGASDQ
jgi:hypothetical protein